VPCEAYSEETRRRRLEIWLDRLQQFCENGIKCKLISFLRYARRTRAWRRFVMYVRMVVASKRMIDQARTSDTYAEMKLFVHNISNSLQDCMMSFINANSLLFEKEDTGICDE